MRAPLTVAAAAAWLAVAVAIAIDVPVSSSTPAPEIVTDRDEMAASSPAIESFLSTESDESLELNRNPTTTSTTSSTLPDATFDVILPAGAPLPACAPGGWLPGQRIEGHLLTAEVVDAICRHWPAEARRFAVAMMACEAGFDPAADNPRSSALGIAQFIRSSWDWYARSYGVDWPHSSAVDLERSVELGAYAYSLSGRSPWSGRGTSEPCWREYMR